MNTWKDVRNYLESDEPLPLIPEGMEVVPVAGVSFVPGYPDNIIELQRTYQARSGDLFVSLVRNPENVYDSNAVEVRYNGEFLGHLPKEVAAKVSPAMSLGTRYTAIIFQIRISPENPNNPGLDIAIKQNSVFVN